MCASVALTTCLLPISGRSVPAGNLAKGGVRRGSVLRAALAAGGSAGRPGSPGWYNSELGKASGRGSVAVRSGSGSGTGGGGSGSASGGGGSGGGKDGSGSGSGGAGGGNNGGSSGSGGSSGGGGSGGRGGPLSSPGRTQEQAPPAATQTKVLQVSKSVMYGVAGVLIVGLGVASYPFLLWQMGDVELRFQKKCLDKRVQYTNEFQELERQQYEQFQEHNRKLDKYIKEAKEALK